MHAASKLVSNPVLILVLTFIRLSLVLVSDLNSRRSLAKIRDGEIRFLGQFLTRGC